MHENKDDFVDYNSLFWTDNYTVTPVILDSLFYIRFDIILSVCLVWSAALLFSGDLARLYWVICELQINKFIFYMWCLSINIGWSFYMIIIS